MKKWTGFVCALVVTCAASVKGATIYSDDFSVDTSANYNTFITQTTTPSNSGDATFVYDYGAAPGSGGLSIPSAPHSTGGSTTGLRLRTDNLGNSAAAAVVGATTVITKNLSLTAPYTVQVDVWSNYIGGSNISASGSNGTTAAAVGIGTVGTSQQYIAGNDGLLVESFGDNGGGANQAYRLYLDNAHPNPTTASYWAAGTSASSATFSDPYYTSRFPSVSGPAGQSSFAASQSGSTAAGTLGFAWHTWQVSNDGTTIIWAIDGNTITTSPVSAVTFGGSQVSLGADDTGTGGNTVANNQLLNAHIFDNLIITDTALPEPAALGLIGLAGIGMLRRNRLRRA